MDKVVTRTYGISLKNLYRIRERGYKSAFRNGKTKVYCKSEVDNRICDLERKRTKFRGGFR
jgi:hypothetical protein